MSMEYFRLEVNPDEIGIVLDTNTRNNIKRCPYQNDFSEVLKMILGVSAQTGFTLNETYALAESVVYDAEQWNRMLAEDKCLWRGVQVNPVLIELINKTLYYHYEDCENGIVPKAFDLNSVEHKSYIWDYIYENARLQINQQAPQYAVNVGRYDSAYFFHSVKDCEYYRDYNGMSDGKVCKVEVLKEYSSFTGDMNILEQLPLNSTGKEVLLAAADYWMKKQTDSPILETLFQGKYRLVPLS